MQRKVRRRLIVTLLLLLVPLSGVVLIRQLGFLSTDVSEYQAIAEWIEASHDGLPALQISTFHAYLDRVSEREVTTSEMPDLSRTELAERWHTFQRASREYHTADAGIQPELLAAPLNIQVLDTIAVDFKGAGYFIDVIAYDALPGMQAPANIYYPAVPTEDKLPVVLTPLGCETGLATHDEVSSAQRRAANLALRGFIVGVTNGLCNNGILGSVARNHNAYDSYAIAAGGGNRANGFQISIWIRLLNYLESRPDADISRVGVTGYSNGGGISQRLFAFDSRVSAAAIVATTFRLPGSASKNSETLHDETFSSTYYAASLPHIPEHFIYTPSLPQLFDPPNRSTYDAAFDALPLSIQQIAFVDISRPIIYILGAGDETNSRTIGEVERWIDLVTPIAPQLGFEDTTPELIIVGGNHNYDAERRRLAADWLAATLEASAILPLPDNAFEHETPIQKRNDLEPRPEGFGAANLHSLFADEALETIRQRRETHPFPTNVAAARDRLGEWLQLPADTDGQYRSIQYRQQGFAFDGQLVDVQRWLVALPYDVPFYAELTLIKPFEGDITGTAIMIAGDAQTLPDEELLTAWLADGRAIGILTPPSYGAMQWPQTSRGNLSQQAIRYDYTLVGLGVLAVSETHTLLEKLNLATHTILYADGVEPSIIAMFAIAMDDRAECAELHHSIDSFTDLLTAPSRPIIPPVLYIPGILSVVDVPDLQALAGEGVIQIRSTSDLSEFAPNF